VINIDLEEWLSFYNVKKIHLSLVKLLKRINYANLNIDNSFSFNNGIISCNRWTVDISNMNKNDLVLVIHFLKNYVSIYQLKFIKKIFTWYVMDDNNYFTNVILWFDWLKLKLYHLVSGNNFNFKYNDKYNDYLNKLCEINFHKVIIGYDFTEDWNIFLKKYFKFNKYTLIENRNVLISLLWKETYLFILDIWEWDLSFKDKWSRVWINLWFWLIKEKKIEQKLDNILFNYLDNKKNIIWFKQIVNNVTIDYDLDNKKFIWMRYNVYFWSKYT